MSKCPWVCVPVSVISVVQIKVFTEVPCLLVPCSWLLRAAQGLNRDKEETSVPFSPAISDRPESAAAWGGQSALRGSQPFLQRKNYITVSLCAAIAKPNVCSVCQQGECQTYIFNNKLHVNLTPIKTAAVMWMRYKITIINPRIHIH